MQRGRGTVQHALLAFLLAGAQIAAAQQQPKRLSGWLLEQPAGTNSYPLGLSWRVPGEEPPQQLQRYELLEDLAAQPSLPRLEEWVSTLPITGRGRVASADPRWLLTHPRRDPFWMPGRTVRPCGRRRPMP